MGISMIKTIKILFLSPEVTPFAKSGGLADVAGSLPLSLKRSGADVRIVIPNYHITKEGNFKNQLLIKDMEVPLGEEKLKVDVLETFLGEDIPVYLLEREDMYGRSNLYGNSRGDYYDNLERFSFFSHASLLVSRKLDFKPDIIHCHDWQTGIIPALLKGPYSSFKDLTDALTVFTIHNMGYQGIFPDDKLNVTGLNKRDFFHPAGIEYWGKISLLKAGIVYSDAVTTVSPTYAREIQTPEFGMGMEGILKQRSDSLYGILNGVDYNIWNPSNDEHIPVKYSNKRMSGKSRCKELLIKEMDLDPTLKARPLLAIISRLDTQKGIDILLDILDEILAFDLGLVVLGAGDETFQNILNQAAKHHRGNIGIKIGFDDPLAHRIMAGSDIFLIPSRYEPCGLTQMYALKYGTVPLVRATGGLNDTIKSFDEKTGNGNGFKFGSYSAEALLKEIEKAVSLFNDKKAWKKLMSNGMNSDFSWDRSAKSYLDLYLSIMKKG
jgi:starch synthase